MLCTTATNNSNAIRTQAGVGRTAVGILIRVIMCLNIGLPFNYRSLYDTISDDFLSADKAYMSEINLQQGTTTVENRKTKK